MKTVILAGGLGTRLSEETGLRPKPMVEIGGRPILWHIMKMYSYYGFNDFIILTGYLSHIIKDYFINYYTRYSDITVDLSKNSVQLHANRTEPWRVTMLYTGANTMTGGRIAKAKEYLKDEPFFLTYGDGVADINLNELVQHHKASKKIATLTSIQPTGKFGALNIDAHNNILDFKEKPKGTEAWINGGFFVCEPEIFNYIEDKEDCIFEKSPMEKLVKDGQLNAYKHYGFWRAMDTLKDKNELTEMWMKESAPWAIWREDSQKIKQEGLLNV